MNKSITIIGSGPGGYVSAIKAAQKGFNVNIIEKDSFGGTCLNIGCIPTKALLYPIEYLNRNYNRMGIITNKMEIDLKKMNAWKKSAVMKSVKGVEFLLKKYSNINIYKGEGKLISKNEVKVNDNIIKSDYIILAMGSIPNVPKVFNIEGIWTSNDALELREIPEKLIIIGAGVIGVEIGSIYKNLGSEVVLIDLLNNAGGLYIDEEIAKELEKELTLNKIQLKLGVGVKEIGVDHVTLETGEVINGTKVMVAVGRSSLIPNWVIENGINVEKGKIVVNENLQTNIENVFAIGDLIDGPMLAHKASHDGIKVIKYLNNEERYNYPIPSVIYTHPEISWVGMTEKEAKELYGESIKIGKFPYSANSRANCTKSLKGFVKIIRYKDRIIGAHIVGENASEMIWGLSLVIGEEIPIKKLEDLVFAHPTYSESIHEAFLGTDEGYIHI